MRQSSRASKWLMIGVCLAGSLCLSACNRGPDISTPKKAATAFAKAMQDGDMDAVKKTAMGSDAQYAAVKTMGDMVQAGARYRAAVTAKFGEQPRDTMIGGVPDINADLQDADEKIDGDTATVSKKDSMGGLKLKKDSDGWKVDLASLGVQGQDMYKMMKPMIDALDGTTKDVNDGKFKTAAEAQMAVGSRMLGSSMPH